MWVRALDIRHENKSEVLNLGYKFCTAVYHKYRGVIHYKKKMQLDVGNEPYLSQQRCLDHLLTWFFFECSHWNLTKASRRNKLLSSQFLSSRIFVTDRQKDAKWCIIAQGGIKNSPKRKGGLGIILTRRTRRWKAVNAQSFPFWLQLHFRLIYS